MKIKHLNTEKTYGSCEKQIQWSDVWSNFLITFSARSLFSVITQPSWVTSSCMTLIDIVTNRVEVIVQSSLFNNTSLSLPFLTFSLSNQNWNIKDVHIILKILYFDGFDMIIISVFTFFPKTEKLIEISLQYSNFLKCCFWGFIGLEPQFL